MSLYFTDEYTEVCKTKCPLRPHREVQADPGYHRVTGFAVKHTVVETACDLVLDLVQIPALPLNSRVTLSKSCHLFEPVSPLVNDSSHRCQGCCQK